MSRPALWWAASIFIHRWLGIAAGVLFIAWFASGIAMMYVRMPALSKEEQLFRQPPLDLSSAHFSPAQAAARAGAHLAETVQVSMLGERPVYRFPGRAPVTVFADTAEALAEVTREQAMALARGFMPEHAATLWYDALLREPDQWTLQARGHFPLHRIGLGDDAETYLYFSSQTGEPVMKTTGGERFWAYLGPVTHWLYWPFLRRDGAAWTQVIIWSSGIGCVMCVLGLLVGVLRYSWGARFRMRGAPSRSPYAGLLKWHHVTGLLFGLVTLTWTFSGLLSMGPFDLLSGGGLTPEQRAAITGDSSTAGAITLTALGGAIATLGHDFAPKELSLLHFRGEPYWLAEKAPRADRPDRWTSVNQAARPPLEIRLVSALHPEAGSFPRFSEAAMAGAASSIMPNVAMQDQAWLSDYDTYYYDRRGARPLPVLRIRYADPQGTWLYLDPQHGAIALVSRPRDRVNRWLYHGLHSFDVRWLYEKRPLWDVTLISLSVGGILLGATTLLPGWRRLRRLGSNLSTVVGPTTERRAT